MGERLDSVEHRQVWLDGRFHHMVVFEDENSLEAKAENLDPKTELPLWRTWTGPLFLGRHGTVRCWSIIDVNDVERDFDLAEKEVGLLVPRLFWDITHRWVDESKKCGYFYLSEKEKKLEVGFWRRIFRWLKGLLGSG